MLALESYEQDLCPGCGWPRTYTMHADAKKHWHASDAIRCYGCTAKHAKEDAAADTRRGAYYVASPDIGMVHAMADPILTYPADHARARVGGSGLYYPPEEDT